MKLWAGQAEVGRALAIRYDKKLVIPLLSDIYLRNNINSVTNVIITEQPLDNTEVGNTDAESEKYCFISGNFDSEDVRICKMLQEELHN